ncbi:hypothetical protein [Streptomyces tsukubensis]|uniref:hypothetical protein n=1 Tax=Streptomyces tsukubensis TaxID=83656 RepID=UPI00117D629C|nr:hypothetical protein [Streptomyces tsukubensis]QFR93080.1 hypothetical protein GBW32_08340 [Streptomyces tsukubensis]
MSDTLAPGPLTGPKTSRTKAYGTERGACLVPDRTAGAVARPGPAQATARLPLPLPPPGAGDGHRSLAQLVT